MLVRWVNYLWDEPHPAISQDFEQLESHWGIRLPEDYKSIAATYQGMSPEPGVFNVGKGASVFNVLLTVVEDSERPVYSVMSAYEVVQPHVPEGIYPFAETPGGEYLCFDYRGSPDQPKVVLVTVEMFIYPVANSFTEFLANLHDGRILLA